METVAIDPLARQLLTVQSRFGAARLETTSDGQRVLVVPDVPLPVGWNKESVTIRLLVPVGFPHVKPDCFYADADLRLRNGSEPANGNVQAVFGAQYRWFSWHLTGWDPTTGTLDQYVRFCQARLKETR